MSQKHVLGAVFMVCALFGVLLGCSKKSTGSTSDKAPTPSSTHSVLFDQTKWVGGLQRDATNRKKWVQDLHSIGMNTVEVTAYAKQGTWNRADLQFEEPSTAVLQEIRTAKKLGMKVVLILRTEIDTSNQENDFLWHGMIYPESEEDLKSWFARYQQFASMWAEVAEQEEVDMLVIGSELNALFATHPTEVVPNLHSYLLGKKFQEKYKKRIFSHLEHVPTAFQQELSLPGYENLQACIIAEGDKKEEWAKVISFKDSPNRVDAINQRRRLMAQYWKGLIGHTRTIYSGKVSIAANFDNYRELDFWSELDCLSINAYFPLRSPFTEGEEVMFNSWLKWFTEINSFREYAGILDRPVFFTELGYSPYSGSAVTPWSGDGFSLVRDSRKDSLFFWRNQKKDTTERNLAVKTLVQSVRQSNFPLQGVLYWKFATQEFNVAEDPFSLKLEANSPGYIQRTLVELND